MVFQKCQIFQLSSTSIASQTRITRYIVFISKHEVSLCVLLPVRFKWLNFRWNVLFGIGRLESRDAKHLWKTSSLLLCSNPSIFKSTNVFLHQSESQSIGLYLTKTKWLVPEVSLELASEDINYQVCRNLWVILLLRHWILQNDLPSIQPMSQSTNLIDRKNLVKQFLFFPQLQHPDYLKTPKFYGWKL